MVQKPVKHDIEPIFAANSLVLVLGTMPSPQSRRQGFYYAHPQNRFWPVLARVFGEPEPERQDIPAKRSLIIRQRLALWDVLAECSIDGAADSSIRRPRPNNLPALISRTQIRAVFCTGLKAYQLYQRLCAPQTHIPAVRLPSTSPANRRISDDGLFDAYRQIKATRDMLITRAACTKVFFT